MKEIPVIIDGKTRARVHYHAGQQPARLIERPHGGKIVKLRLHQVGRGWEYRQDGTEAEAPG